QVPKLATGEHALIPVAVAIPQARELIGDNGPQCRPDASARNMVLGQSTDPQVDVVYRSIFSPQLLLQLGIAGDLVEVSHSGQAVCSTNCVVVRQTMIATALNIQAGKIESACAGRPEKEVADFVDHPIIDFRRWIR